MRIKILAENVLIGLVNYVKGQVLEYAASAGIKDALIASGKAEVTQDAPKNDTLDFKPAVLPVVEDKATLFHPVDGGLLTDRGPNDLLVTAQSEILPDGKPATFKVKEKK